MTCAFPGPSGAAPPICDGARSSYQFRACIGNAHFLQSMTLHATSSSSSRLFCMLKFFLILMLAGIAVLIALGVIVLL
jgi:hypothetical protein